MFYINFLMVLKKDRTRTNEKIVLSPVLKVTQFTPRRPGQKAVL